MGVSLRREAGAVDESEQRREGAVVRRSLPAREHGFLGERFRPVLVRATSVMVVLVVLVVVGGASPLAAGLGRRVQGRQGGELGQLALVEFVGVLRGEKRIKKIVSPPPGGARTWRKHYHPGSGPFNWDG